ncbi:MAG TPA: hypothetical protein VM261_09990 [Kofleriaceae bacterium]|nr:hypothetical protein [Kofleriaceae bacterium]
MSETNKDAPRSATPPPVGDQPSAERTDDSGVHDMKALAQTAKQRISRRITSQHDAYDESLLSSSQSGLRAVALPVQAQVISLPAMPTSIPGAAEIAGAEAAGITPIEAARGKKSKTVWFVAGGGVIAAAAAAVFLITAGAGQKKEAEMTASAGAASGSAVMKDVAPSAGAGADMGTGAAGIAAGSSAASGTTVAALDPQDDPAMTPPTPAEEAAKTETETHDRAGAAGKTAAKGDSRTGGEGRAAGSGSSAGDKQQGGKERVKAGAGGGGGGGGAAGGGAVAPKGPGGDSMEDLLAAASGGAQKPTEGGDTGGAKPEKTGLDGKDIRSGMGAVSKQAQACFDQHGVAGHVKIKATVDPSGKVTKADATGEFAGTPTGSCVAAAAKSASFPEWAGAPMTISYGFTLTE